MGVKITLENIINSTKKVIGISLLVGALTFSPLFLYGCKKSGKEAREKAPESRTYYNPQTKTLYKPGDERVQGLTAESLSLQNRIAILNTLIKDFETIKGRLVDRNEQGLLIFVNPVEQTLSELKKFKKGYEGLGMVYPVETLAQAELDYSTFNSDEYWKDLKSALQGYGYLESGRIRTARNAILTAKGFFNTSFPENVFLIKEASHRGFFTRKNGDLVIPGIRFYQDVLENRISIDSLPKTDQYFKSRYENALALIEKGQARRGIKELELFLEDFMAPDELKSNVYYNMAVTHEKLGEYFEAIATYNTSIEIKPTAESCYMRGRLYLGLRMYKNALDSLNQALPLAKDSATISQIRRGITICNENIRPGN